MVCLILYIPFKIEASTVPSLDDSSWNQILLGQLMSRSRASPMTALLKQEQPGPGPLNAQPVPGFLTPLSTALPSGGHTLLQELGPSLLRPLGGAGTFGAVSWCSRVTFARLQLASWAPILLPSNLEGLPQEFLGIRQL